jgi:hypothetical protein
MDSSFIRNARHGLNKAIYYVSVRGSRININLYSSLSRVFSCISQVIIIIRTNLACYYFDSFLSIANMVGYYLPKIIIEKTLFYDDDRYTF